MPNQNSKALTIKIPRGPITVTGQDHLLDVLLACAFHGTKDPLLSHAERIAFEQSITKDSRMNPQVKEALTTLSQQERFLLFR